MRNSNFPRGFAVMVLAALLLVSTGAPTSAGIRPPAPQTSIQAGSSRVLLPLLFGPEATPYRLVPGSATCAPNPGVSYFNGVVRDRAGTLQNGVCVHVAFFGPRTTKCSGCDGVGDGNWGFSPFGGPAGPNIPVEIFVVRCPAFMPPGGQSDNFGDLTPQSDKWELTTSSTSMQCTGITFQQK